MINFKVANLVKTNYNVDLLRDIIFSSNKQIKILFDENSKRTTAYLLSGNLEIVGLPNFEEILAYDLLKYIETNNLLAEVEGRHTFIKKIVSKFKNMEDELYLYIPIKRKDKPIWLHMSFRRIKETKLILGKVYRIDEDTPISIIHYQKTYQDSLTKLFTRDTLKMHMSNIINTKDSYFCYVDLDNFKKVNDKYGHQAGDEFIVDLSKEFINNWEYNVIYYRLGGDEFGIYCYDHSEEEIIKRSKSLINQIENLKPEYKKLKISASIGITKIRGKKDQYHILLNESDKAMYQAKEKGGGTFIIYN